MTCEHLHDVEALYDEVLEESRQAEVRAHLVTCAVCREEWQTLQQLAELLRESDVAVDTSAQKHEQMKQLLMERCGLPFSPTGNRAPGAGADPPSRPWSAWLSDLRRFFPSSAVTRRVLAPALSVLLIVALSLTFVNEAPAQTLAKVLNAMSRVRSAHYSGSFISYLSRDRRTGRPIPGRMRSEWWYLAPDRFRRYHGPKVAGWGIYPGTLIINGQLGLVITEDADGPVDGRIMRRAGFDRYLTPIDFFSQEGLIGRAEREGKSRVSRHSGTYQGREVTILTVRVEEVSSQHQWVLYTDPATSLIRRSEYTVLRRTEKDSVPLMKEILERFEYDVPIDERKFRLEVTANGGPAADRDDVPQKPRDGAGGIGEEAEHGNPAGK